MSNQKNSFFNNISLDPVTGCWNWTAARNADGYGTMRFMGKVQKVHRISAMLYLGYKPDSELLVLHRCDNPPCFNPKHLFFGTDKDNVLDSLRKGRHANASKTTCPKGHPYSGSNLYIRPNPRRHNERGCKACIKEAEKFRRK